MSDDTVEKKINVLPAKGYLQQPAEFNYRCWGEIELPDGHAYEDLFDPRYWQHHASGRVAVHDLIRVIGFGRKFDVQITVTAKTKGGLEVEPWPKLPDAESMAAVAVKKAEPLMVRIVDGKELPRPDFTRSSNWRVLGYEGSELSRGHDSKATAHAAMVAYYRGIGKELVWPEKQEAAA